MNSRGNALLLALGGVRGDRAVSALPGLLLVLALCRAIDRAELARPH